MQLYWLRMWSILCNWYDYQIAIINMDFIWLINDHILIDDKMHIVQYVIDNQSIIHPIIRINMIVYQSIQSIYDQYVIDYLSIMIAHW